MSNENPLEEIAHAARQSARHPNARRPRQSGNPLVLLVLIPVLVTLGVFLVNRMLTERGMVIGDLANVFNAGPVNAMNRSEIKELEEFNQNLSGLLAVRSFSKDDGTLEVGQFFYLVDYSKKLRFCELLLRFTRETSPEVRAIRIVDYRSNREVGRYNGLKLEIETDPSK